MGQLRFAGVTAGRAERRARLTSMRPSRRDRFVHRINHVDEAGGFIRNEVLRPSLTQLDQASGEWCVGTSR